DYGYENVFYILRIYLSGAVCIIITKGGSFMRNNATLLKFIIPSLIGILMFIFPISLDGETTIPVAFLANILNESLGFDKVVLIVVIIINISALFTLIFSWIYRPKNAFLANLFTVNPVWVILRIVGAVFSIMAIMTVGPEAVNSDVTGGMLLND